MNVEPTGQRVANLVVRIVLAAPLLFAGAVKLANPLSFRNSLDAYHLFPLFVSIVLAVVLPPFEILCGVLLLIGFQRRAAALAVAALMLGFSTMAAISLWHGAPSDCGCFGSIAWLDWPPAASMARDLVLLALAVWLCREEIKSA